MQNKPLIQTYSGLILNPFSPKDSEIKVEDIAHSLSNICRFNGHVSEFYSVAQHSVFVSELCVKSPKHGLLHDASEAYMHDIASPIKRSGAFYHYRVLEKKLQKIIYEKFGLEEEPPELKQADLIALSVEGINFMKNKEPYGDNLIEKELIPLPPKQAKQLFLDTFEKLFGAIL